MHDVAYTFLGAALVAIGVLLSALGDRIRSIRLAREADQPIPHIAPSARPRTVAVKPERLRASHVEGREHQSDGADDVISALVATGYKKPVATEAVRGCSATERATIEVWTRSALRRAARGGMS